MTTKPRVRFAPSPTGFMHLGNVRAALINKLFALKNNGTFVLRIEDTDTERNIIDGEKQIIEDLTWLGITHNEGPTFQSNNHDVYEQHLKILQDKNLVYRCFETAEELEAMREEQRAQNLPPRYNRAALKLTPEEIQQNLDAGKPFIWRFKLPEGSIAIRDLARGPVNFDMAHFSDFAITRQDGTCTFIFANFVDDLVSNITHIFRGEDHLTNSANQAALYKAFDPAFAKASADKKTLPEFYHLPLICNSDGKKLSKRDFGFSLNDLRTNGFIPEAICNYLAIIGASFKKEIMDFDTLVQTIRFDRSSPKGNIHYDVEKLRWVNHKWIGKLELEDLGGRCFPLLKEHYPEVEKLDSANLSALLSHIQNDMMTLHDAVELLQFYFIRPDVQNAALEEFNMKNHEDFFQQIVNDYAGKTLDPSTFFGNVKERAKADDKPMKEIFSLLRLSLTGKSQGLGIKDLVSMLNPEETIKRINNIVHREYHA